MSGFFLELSLVMIIALFMSFIFYKLKQPLLVGYIFTGILSGPIFFNILSSAEGYTAFSHIGIAFLLFIVGLHLNLKLIKEIGVVAIVVGFGQITLTVLMGFGISLLFGFGFFSAFLIAMGLSFSSTIIIIKLLSDKKEIEKIHGKIATGVLIVQDLVAVIMLIVLASISNANSGSLIMSLIKTFVVGIFALGGVLIFSKYVLEKVLDWIASSQEFLFTFIISWCFGVSTLFAFLNFSVEVGALMAGIALASSPYQYEISSRIKPLRDFFIIIFFISLGSQMIPVTQIPNIEHYASTNIVDMFNVFVNNLGSKFVYLVDIFSEILVPAIVLSLFVIIVKPILVFVLMNLLRFHSKSSFKTGISLAQISEFSLIMILIAKESNLASSPEVSVLTLVAIITILVSTYMIMHSDKIYTSMHKFVKILEFKKPKKDIEKEIQSDLDVLVFGYDRIGFSLLKTIDRLKKSYLIIDYNPAVIKKLDEKGAPCMYGDASDNDFVSEFNLEFVKMFVSTIPDLEVSMTLLKQLKSRNKKATIILTAHQIDDALELYNEGADYVILPHFLGGDYISGLIEKHNGKLSNFLDEKVQHISDLKERKEYGLEHPVHNK